MNSELMNNSHEGMARYKHAVIGDGMSKFEVKKFPTLHIKAVANNKADAYKATLEKCNCPDFKKHGIPCVHMYALALQAGIYEEIIRADAHIGMVIKKLSDKAFKYFSEKLYGGYYSEFHKEKSQKKILEELQAENLIRIESEGFYFSDMVNEKIKSVIYYTFSDDRYKAQK